MLVFFPGQRSTAFGGHFSAIMTVFSLYSAQQRFVEQNIMITRALSHDSSTARRAVAEEVMDELWMERNRSAVVFSQRSKLYDECEEERALRGSGSSGTAVASALPLLGRVEGGRLVPVPC